MSRSTIRLLLFDAFDTLLHPRLPPHVQYVRTFSGLTKASTNTDLDFDLTTTG